MAQNCMRYDCRFGLPHDLIPVGETSSIKVERCTICGKQFRWQKGFKGRVSNAEYLKAHARNYAQPDGATNALFQKLYHPNKCVISL